MQKKTLIINTKNPINKDGTPDQNEKNIKKIKESYKLYSMY